MKKRKQILLLCLSFFIIGQAQVTKSINVDVAGNLYTLLTFSEKTTVTDLTISGSLDARDFKIIRDSMPVLSILDLSAVTIAAYNGANGTDIYGGQNYLENTIPQFSFYKGNGVGKITLTTITFPTTAISIGMNAFECCTGLASITIPNSITSIGSATFANCYELKSIILPNRITSIENATFYDCFVLASIEIPNSVKTIGEYAFQDCEKLTTIIIPDSVTTIKKNAFQNCTSLTTITVPNSVTFIGDNAFGNINFYKDQPDGVIYVGKCAYKYKGDTLVNSNITIADGTTQLCYCAFYGRSDMISITIPNTVTSIGSMAFSRCMGLTTITIPNSVDSIAEMAFYGCIGLKSLTINAVVPPVNLSYNTFQFVADTIPLIVPRGSLNAYNTTFCWSYFKNIQEAPTSLTNVSATSYSIHYQGRKIIIDNASNLGIQIFDISGRKVAEITKASQNEILTVHAAGVYVIKVGNRSTKVIVE